MGNLALFHVRHFAHPHRSKSSTDRLNTSTSHLGAVQEERHIHHTLFFHLRTSTEYP